ncbi:MAG: catalase [Planctomycetes bacterium]|nr:catalase [Planctomycetota bacterium]
MFREDPQGAVQTTDQGLRIAGTEDSLKAGERGPTLLEDFHLREKIMRFDHERIPERVVHARGAGAHGHFQVYESLAGLTSAAFLQDPKATTPVFVRFSTVVGSRGSADTARDVRGFAAKFYTSEGNFDLVGNNMPVFFIQDGIKFPDLVHALKPDPRKEIPQAASAHDSFWDFVSLMPETAHMVMWVMSDRALPRSYRMMEGFGVHTFRLVNAAGETHLVKFHWKPKLGAHALVWDEAQLIAGRDPDFHRRDLWDAIAAGAFPEYELGIQVVPETDALRYGFDLLDPTKLLPEEVVPVRLVGKLTLTRNPSNYFSEVEQVAFCVANLVPGIDVTDDPLMQARLFSYLDTQLTRLGGPNFAELPINRPIVPVHNHQQDGFGRHAIPTSEANYHPNSIAGGMPKAATGPGAFAHVRERIDGQKLRKRSGSFADHFSQATLFVNSLSGPEREHLIDALRFELGKVERPEIRSRVIDEILAPVSLEVAREVASAIGVPPPGGRFHVSAHPPGQPTTSPALSLAITVPGGIATRKVAILASPGSSGRDIAALRKALVAGGAVVEVIAGTLGPIDDEDGKAVAVDKSFLTAASVMYDAVAVPSGEVGLGALYADPQARRFVLEAYRHGKAIALAGGARRFTAVWGAGEESGAAGDPAAEPGVVFGALGKEFTAAFVTAIGMHRHWGR